MNETGKRAIHNLVEQGASELKEGSFEAAIETFTASLVIERHNAKALQGRGSAYFQIKDFASAETDFKLARDLEPDDLENWSGLGLSMVMQNRIYEAIAVFETVLQKKPDYIQGYIHLGVLNLKIGAISKGRDHLQKALTFRPTLSQRRMIESLLKDQEKLDGNRYYRPDFEKLKKQSSELFFVPWLRKALGSLKKNNRLGINLV